MIEKINVLYPKGKATWKKIEKNFTLLKSLHKNWLCIDSWNMESASCQS